MARKAETADAKITAVVCTHNRYDVLGEALLSLDAQSLPRQDYEVIVIDNSSDRKETANFWKRNRGRYEARVEISDRPGLSRARNMGAKLARAPLVAFLDDDAIASSTWLETLAHAFQAAPGAGVVGGPVQPIWPGDPPKWLHPWLTGFYTIVDLGREDRDVGENEWLAGANIAFRRELLEAVGGFDETLGRVGGLLLSNEDLEATRRIRALGSSVRYAAGALVRHQIDKARTRQDWLRRRVAWQAVSDALLAGGRQAAEREDAWRQISDYLLAMPVEFRNLRGLFLDVESAEDYNRQCIALGALVRLLLFDGRDPEAPATR